NLRSELPKRNAVIKNGNASSVRGNDQIRSARMNLNIIDPHRRNIANANPMRALIKRGEHSEMRSRVKQFWIHRIFAYDLDGVVRRKIAGDRCPCLAQVGRSPDRGTIVTRPITIGSDVRHISIEMRRLDARYPLPARRLR